MATIAQRVARSNRQGDRSQRQRAPGNAGGDQALMRDDVGIRMTGAEYDMYQKVGTEKTKIGNAQTALDTAYGKLDTEYHTQRKAIADAEARLRKAENVDLNGQYEKAKKGFVPVRVVDGDQVQQTYYLPREAVDKMNNELFNQEGGYVGNWVDGGKFYNVDTTLRDSGEKYGKELHQSMRTAELEVENMWFTEAEKQLKIAQKQNAPKIAKAWEQINNAKTALNTTYATSLGTLGDEEESIRTARNELNKYDQWTEDDVKEIKTQQEASTKHRQALFGG